MSTHPSLRDALGDYLALRRALGFKLANAGRLLGQFVHYLDEHGTGIPTTDHALTWANLPASTSGNWRAIRLSVVRGFALYLHSLDATVEVPSADLIRHGPDRATPICIPMPKSVDSSPQPASYGPDCGQLRTRP
jgi:integrase/recombinase XerD